MKKVFSLLIFTFLISNLSFSAKIAGVVTNQDNQPMKHAFVRLLNADNDEDKFHGNHVFTDENGVYEFNDLENGSYIVFAKKMFHQAIFYNGVTNIDDAEVIEITNPEQEISGINIQLQPWGYEEGPGIISGSFTSPSGEPLNGVITIFKLNEDNDHNSWQQYRIVRVSQVEGDYQIENLPEGSLFLLAHAQGPFKKVFYDNVQTIEEAAPIEISDENYEFIGIDFVFEFLPGFGEGSISGTVSDNTGNIVQNGIVKAIHIFDPNEDKNHHPNFMPFISPIDSLGNYSINNLGAGEYKIFFASFGYKKLFYENSETFEEADIVSLEDNQELTGINAVLEKIPTGIIAGFITDQETGEPIDSALVSIVPRHNGNSDCSEDCDGTGDCDSNNSNPPNGHHGFGNMTVITNEEGYYEFPEVLEGKYIVYSFKPNPDNHPGGHGGPGGNMNHPHFLYMPKFYDNKANPLEADILQVQEDGTYRLLAEGDLELVESVDITLEEFQPSNSSISGSVTNQGENINQPVMVIAFSEDQQVERAALTDENGNFRLNRLSSQNYYVLAVAPFSAPTYYESALSWEEADLVIVDGEVTDINIDLLPLEEEDGTNAVYGTITDDTGNPISGVSVIIYNSFGENIGTTLTDVSGSYRIENLIGGTYSIKTDKIFYTSANSEIVINEVFGEVESDLLMNPTGATAIEEEYIPNRKAFLKGSYPNPFNPVTTIDFSVTEDNTPVRISIFNVNGKLIKTLTESEFNKGSYSVNWNGLNQNGEDVTSGIYFSVLDTGNETSKIKMLLIK